MMKFIYVGLVTLFLHQPLSAMLVMHNHTDSKVYIRFTPDTAQAKLKKVTLAPKMSALVKQQAYFFILRASKAKKSLKEFSHAFNNPEYHIYGDEQAKTKISVVRKHSQPLAP